MSDLNPQPLPPRAIDVQLPATIFNDLEAFQKVQASLLELAGCPGCTSGIQFRWRQLESYIVSPKGEIRALPNQEAFRLTEG
jgi:hypothetical protein